MGSASAVGKGFKAEDGIGAPRETRTFEVIITKNGADDKLGMDVKQTKGSLEVVQVFADGAIERSNERARRRQPPGECLQVGDVIWKVNGVAQNDHQMVAYCRLSEELRLEVTRCVR